MGDDGSCPYCGEEREEGARSCACGYVFEGYEEARLAEDEVFEEERRTQSRTGMTIGALMIGAGLLLSGLSFAAADAGGGGRYTLFFGLVIAGAVTLFRSAR